MNEHENYSGQNIPQYKTKSEVLKAAHQNQCFFESFSESLKNSWKFYY